MNQISAAYTAFSDSATELTKATMLMYLHYYPTNSEPNQRCLYRLSGNATALTKATMLEYLLYYPTHSEPNQRCLYRLFRQCHSANKGYHANVSTLLP